MLKGHTRRQVVVAAATLALAAVGLTGCATGGAPSPKGSGSKNLTVFTYDNAEPAALLKTQFAAFTKKTGIKVALETLPGSGAAVYPSKLRTQLTGGKGPDIWRIWGGSIGSPFADNGFAADLSKYYSKYNWGSKIPASDVAGMTFNGVKAGLPLYGVTVTAWYSKSAFKKAGIAAPPTTYAELTADNDKLVKAGIVPAGLGGKYGWDVMRLFEYLLEKNVGPSVHDQLLKGKADWNQAGVVKAFTELKEWNDKGWLPKGVLGIDPTVSEPGFTQGKYAYTIAGAWVDSQNIQSAKNPSDYSTFALPTDQTPMRHSGWVEGFMINKNSPNQDAAAELLNYLATPAVQKAIQNTQSTVQGAGPDPAKYPASVENAKIGASAPYYTIQDQALTAQQANAYFGIQSQVIQGAVTPAQAASQMQPAMQSK